MASPPGPASGPPTTGAPWPMDPWGRPWPMDPWGRPWPVDQYGRYWPADPYGRPTPPQGPPPQNPPPPTDAAQQDPRLYRGAPATLAAAVEREAVGGPPVRVATWGLWDILITLVLWLLFAVAGSLAVLATEESSPDIQGVAMIVAVTAPWLALLGWPALITWLRGNGPFIDLGLRWRWKDIAWGLLYGVGCVAAAIGLAILTEAIFGEFSSEAGDLAESLADTKVVFAIFLLTIVVGAPIVEEFFFRGYLFAALAKKGLAPILSVLISAAIFAAFHFELKRILVLLGIGVILGLARWRTSSLTTAIVAHMFNNAVSSISLFVLLFS